MNIIEKLKDEKARKTFFRSLFTLVGFIFILGLSWFYLSRSFQDTEGEYLHGLLQNRFQTLISDSVVKKHPEVVEIIFHKIWTKNTPDSDQIQIFFSYSLRTTGDARGDLVVDGEALLKRSPKKERLWIVQDFQIMDSSLDFSEPLLIKPDLPESS